jgi:hypothetical protein
MKKILLAGAIALGLSASALADQVVYACQYTNSAGLEPEGGIYLTRSFDLDNPFFLTAINNSLTEESVAKAFYISSNYVTCFAAEEEVYREAGQTKWLLRQSDQTCAGSFGQVLYFDYTKLSGARAFTLGGGRSFNHRLSVSTFVCTEVK